MTTLVEGFTAKVPKHFARQAHRVLLIYDDIADTTAPVTGDFTARVAQYFARQAHSVNIVLSA